MMLLSVYCEADWDAGNVSQTAKLGVRTYGRIDAIQSSATYGEIDAIQSSANQCSWPFQGNHALGALSRAAKESSTDNH